MNKKVLLVEDSDCLRILMTAILSKNFDVVSAKNGLEAMSWLSGGLRPDIIVTDARMPELSGSQLITNLRCSGMFRDIPIVVVSGTENEDGELRFKRLGVRSFLRKPFNPTKLTEHLQQIILEPQPTIAIA